MQQSKERPRVLVVDDELFNIEFVRITLEDCCDILHAQDGETALEIAQREKIHIMLLDILMPGMDGYEVCRRIKSNDATRNISVIFTSALDSNHNVLKGLEMGAFYYLIKPYETTKLRAIVHSAMDHIANFNPQEIERNPLFRSMQSIDEITVHFRGLQETKDLAALISRALPRPDKILFGLTELMINAVEHGNLGITYEEKTQLNEREGEWEKEVDRRLELPENKDKLARLHLKRLGDHIELTIVDDGEGFDWQNYLDIHPERIFDNHGRGIALARSMSFDDLSYHDHGRKVVVRIKLEEATAQQPVLS
ncbi:MAG: response regulator [Chromatiales bacterium]